MIFYMQFNRTTNPFILHHQDRSGFTYLKNYSFADVERMMLGDDWTKVTIVREPRERLLSAYLNKAVANLSKVNFKEMDQKLQKVLSTMEQTVSTLNNTTKDIRMHRTRLSVC